MGWCCIKSWFPVCVGTAICGLAEQQGNPLLPHTRSDPIASAVQAGGKWKRKVALWHHHVGVLTAGRPRMAHRLLQLHAPTVTRPSAHGALINIAGEVGSLAAWEAGHLQHHQIALVALFLRG